MLPLYDLRRPRVPRHTQRSDNEYLADLKEVVQEFFDCRKSDDGLAKPTIQENRGFLVLKDKLFGVCLVEMRFIAH
ncbi:hypothetical protein GCM10008919_01510 [Selenomonas dianae]|uniref:Uncharacterized protein n=1 Tax=Selenomonas dianae TaxID=135079 RepID=A0ABP3CGI2_9FIRM